MVTETEITIKELIKEIREETKKKKELRTINNEFLNKKIREEIKKLSKEEINKIKNRKSSEYKRIIKSLRAELRRIHGVFQRKNQKKRQELIKKLSKTTNNEEKKTIIREILKTHQSTLERMNYYEEAYKKIFSITGKPKKILDLGCGLNPLSYYFLDCKPEYYCGDINDEEIKIINDFFKEEKIKGKAMIIDLTSKESRKKFYGIKADTIFLFKTIDTIEEQERNLSKTIIKKIIEEIKPKNIIISFPTKSIGGRRIRKEENKEKKSNNWFSRFLEEEKLKYKIISLEGEEFWIIKKK